MEFGTIQRLPRNFHVVLIAALLAAPLLSTGEAFASAVESPDTVLPTSILYQKDLKQGEYEGFKISLDGAGRGKFEAKPREGDLITQDVEISPESMRRLIANFEAARFLTSKRDYESRLRVADMGLKTLSLKKDGQSRAVQFNYTTDLNINAIADFFGGLITTELRLDSLERAMKYDKLGLPDQIKGLQNEIKNRWLAEPQLLLPVLRKIANNPAFFNMVQRQAHQLVLQIESMKPSSIIK